MKITVLAVAATAFLHLKGPDGTYLYENGEPVGIDMFGPGSHESAQIENNQSARAIKRMQDNDNKFSPPPLEEQRSQGAIDLAAVTSGFRHIEYDDANGQPLTGTPLFVAVYSDLTLGWIKAQAIKFQADWGNFKPG